MVLSARSVPICGLGKQFIRVATKQNKRDYSFEKLIHVSIVFDVLYNLSVGGGGVLRR